MREFSDICRLCLKNQKDYVEEFFNIFDYKKDLSEMIFTCTSIKISLDDKLPKNICEKCLKSVLEFYDFKNMCLYSDENLQKLLKSPNEQMQHLEETIRKECEFVNTTCDDIRLNSPKLHFKYQKKRKFSNITSDGCAFLNPKEMVQIYETDEIIRKIIGDNTYTCDICNVNFTTFFDYFDHQESHNGQFVFKCCKCEEIFNERKLLVEHDYKHKIPCKVCKLEVLPKSMNAHLLIHTDVYKCRDCGARHTSNASLQKHIKARHKGVKGIVCHICGKQSSCQSSMNRHMAYHSNERPHKCKYCTFTAKSLNIVQVHTSRRHFAEKCVCEVCAKLFKSQLSLVQHMKRIHTTKKHMCGICGKAFVERHNLNRHVKKHVGQRLHECKICKKEFFTIRQLKEHMHSHKQGCVNCPQCNKTFFYKKYYEKHILQCTKISCNF